jgi:hypothetical protein
MPYEIVNVVWQCGLKLVWNVFEMCLCNVIKSILSQRLLIVFNVYFKIKYRCPLGPWGPWGHGALLSLGGDTEDWECEVRRRRKNVLKVGIF